MEWIRGMCFFSGFSGMDRSSGMAGMYRKELESQCGISLLLLVIFLCFLSFHPGLYH